MSPQPYQEAALRDLPSPCTKDCPERTATCKFDGSCEKYEAWRVKYDALVEQYEASVHGDRLIVSMLADKRANHKYVIAWTRNRRTEKGGWS